MAFSTSAAIVVAFSVSMVFAWTGPTATPPNGNVAAPINVGSVSQVKSGGIWAASIGSDSGYCIGASCISSWPTGQTSTFTNGITVLGSATSTFSSGINVTSGCFAINGVCLKPGNSGGAAIQTFTSSGTWTKPSSGNVVDVKCWGGGGGAAQGGGGGGGYIDTILPLSSVSASVAVTVGAGGAGKNLSSPGSGSDGSSTTFGSYVTATGGGGGGGIMSNGRKGVGTYGGVAGSAGAGPDYPGSAGGAGTPGYGGGGGGGGAVPGDGAVAPGGAGGGTGGAPGAGSSVTGGTGGTSYTLGVTGAYMQGGAGGSGACIVTVW